MLTIANEELFEKFRELFLQANGKLALGSSSLLEILTILAKEKKIFESVLLKDLARTFYLKPDAFSQQEKEVFKSSPWFPELRLNLKYPTVFDIEDYMKSPNSSWELYLRENKNSFLVFLGNQYITELTLDYKINSFAVWKDYLVVIDENKVLKVIYLYSLKEVHKKEGQGFKEIRADKDRLYLVYENGITQAFEVDEVGIKFGEIVQDISADAYKKEKIICKIKIGNNEVRGLSFSPDGQLLAVSVIKENKVIVFSTYNFKKIREITLSNNPNQVKFSPDSKYLAVGCGDGYAYVYDILDNFKEKYKFKSPKGWVVPVSFSPDGNFFAFGGYGYLALSDFKSGNKKFEKEYGNDSHIYNISFSPSGKYLAFGRYDKKVEVLDTNGDLVIQFDDYIGGYYYTLSFSPDSRLLAYTTANDKVKFISVEDWKPVKEIDGFRFAFSDDGKYIFTTHSDKVMVWDLENFEKIKELVPYKDKKIFSIAVNSEIKLIACGYDDGYLYVLNYESLSKFKMWAHKLDQFLWLDPHLIFVDEYNQAYVWEKENQEFVYKLHMGEVNTSQEFKALEGVEGWIVDSDFILFKGLVVAGSKDFQKHVNVLLGSNIVSFEEFKELILKKPLEVLL